MLTLVPEQFPRVFHVHGVFNPFTLHWDWWNFTLDHGLLVDVSTQHTACIDPVSIRSVIRQIRSFCNMRITTLGTFKAETASLPRVTLSTDATHSQYRPHAWKSLHLCS
ncbi:hypothetical protein BaRGS_00014185 [Batillaria attramentaria]|uniref:Uncharacterized protein n=1 Tax=Batillaria attramentaria TaxID=370345 RepID=A0ABD0L609_9CAEN